MTKGTTAMKFYEKMSGVGKKITRKSIKLTLSIIGCFVLLAVCARITENALPAAAGAAEKPVIVIDAGQGAYVLSGVAI